MAGSGFMYFSVSWECCFIDIWQKVKYVGLSIKELQHQLEGIRMAFVKNNETSKISLVVEEMNPIQAKLFSRLELNEFLI
jgi:hypothetical protein